MLNHSTWRLNDSTFRLNRRRTCQDRGVVIMGVKKNLKKNVLLASLNSQLVERGNFSGIPNLNASTARGRFVRTVGGGSIRQACFRNYSMKAPGRHGHGATTIF